MGIRLDGSGRLGERVRLNRISWIGRRVRIGWRIRFRFEWVGWSPWIGQRVWYNRSRVGWGLQVGWRVRIGGRPWILVRGSGSIVGLGSVGETSLPGLVVDPELDIESGSIRGLG